MHSAFRIQKMVFANFFVFRRQHLQGNRRRLREGHAESVPLEGGCLEHGTASGWEIKSIKEEVHVESSF
jgi:hypothetical protein